MEVNYPDRLFLASIHASTDGSFQAVQPPTFNIDFTTQAGNTYVSEMSGFLGNPMGTINRKETGFLNSVWYFSSDWTNAVANEIASATLKSNLQLAYNYYPQTNGRAEAGVKSSTRLLMGSTGCNGTINNSKNRNTN